MIISSDNTAVGFACKFKDGRSYYYCDYYYCDYYYCTVYSRRISRHRLNTLLSRGAE